MDFGFAYPGVRKPYFREYFLDMKKFKKKRLVFRLIPVREEWKNKPPDQLQWQAWITEDDIPYLLTRRARLKKDYIPAEGEKAIPPWWEEKIKPEHRWWVKGLSPKERLRRLDLAYNDLVERGLIPGRPVKVAESEKKGKFILRRRMWRGQLVVRGTYNIFYDLLFDRGRDHLKVYWFPEGVDPTLGEPSPCVEDVVDYPPPGGESFRDWMSFEGKLPPNNPPENPTKELEVEVEIVDKGEVQFYEENEQFISMRLKGKILKGYYILRREDPDSEMFVFSPSALPGQIREPI